MGFGVVLRDLLSAAEYCAYAPPGESRDEVLAWVAESTPRLRAFALSEGKDNLARCLAGLESAAVAARTDPSFLAQLGPLVLSAFDAHDPSGTPGPLVRIKRPQRQGSPDPGGSPETGQARGGDQALLPA